MIAKSINAIKQFVPSCWALPQAGTPAHANCQKLPSLGESMLLILKYAYERQICHFFVRLLAKQV